MMKQMTLITDGPLSLVALRIITRAGVLVAVMICSLLPIGVLIKNEHLSIVLFFALVLFGVFLGLHWIASQIIRSESSKRLIKIAEIRDFIYLEEEKIRSIEPSELPEAKLIEVLDVLKEADRYEARIAAWFSHRRTDRVQFFRWLLSLDVQSLFKRLRMT